MRNIGVVVILGLLATSANAQKLYWTEGGGKIRRANLDGSDIEDLFTTVLHTPIGLALDQDEGKVYWADSATGKIQRANLDGSNPEDLVETDVEFPRGIALDLAEGYMYWTNAGNRKIQRATLNGLNIEDLVATGLDTPHGIALDLVHGKMYWTDTGTGRVARANIDGSGVATLFSTGTNAPLGIALDVPGGKVYWASYGTRKIRRANLDGSNVEDFLTHLSWPTCVAVDAGAGKLYFALSAALPAPTIQRCNLDGSARETLLTTNLDGPRDLALDVVAGRIYWTTRETFGVTPPRPSGKIFRAKLDGSSPERILAVQTPLGIALDLESEKMYWTDPNNRRIHRAGLDGSDLEVLFTTDEAYPRHIALDLAASKMYWTDGNIDRIQRADLDGSDVEDLVAEDVLLSPMGIALDSVGGRMYWTDVATRKIQRADIDGSDVQDIVSDESEPPQERPYGIAIAPEAATMYWTDTGIYKIRRSSLDGTDVEDLTTTYPVGAQAIAIDAMAEQIYWAISDGIQRSNLNGSAVADVLTDLERASDLALDLRFRADCDSDGSVTLADHHEFAECLTGPGADRSSECRCTDLRSDGHVDLFDFYILQRIFSGAE